MRRNHIESGHFYTNDQASYARQIVDIQDRTVIYHDQDLGDGKLIMFRMKCSITTFASWAARGCSPEEQARSDLVGMERMWQQIADEIAPMLADPIEQVVYRLFDVIGLKYVVKYLGPKGFRVPGRPQL